ncbi:hypothetical protein SAMN05444004_10922 [Jannaschia faecimaris]|uniref:Uncharacterized protein n=1 Tax=Jannaschia faecimaris TaxID=1244108 RepID=A0A1H3RME6_9RHOB|nr:hypothetical protein [Jannaschia faecimaris]SDZ26846.1 hypothetical protein SAMN05444004_10922 [Jannaschia faecimaris]
MSHHLPIAVDNIDASAQEAYPNGTAPTMFCAGDTVRHDVQMTTIQAFGGDLAMTQPFVRSLSNRAPREGFFGTTTFKAIRALHFSNALNAVDTTAAHTPEDI